MGTKQMVIAKAAEIGATIEYGNIGIGNVFEILVDAPEGQHWAGDGVHQLVQSRWGREPIEALWQDSLERMGYGLEPCDDDCDEAMDALDIGKAVVSMARIEEARPAN